MGGATFKVAPASSLKMKEQQDEKVRKYFNNICIYLNITYIS